LQVDDDNVLGFEVGEELLVEFTVCDPINALPGMARPGANEKT